MTHTEANPHIIRIIKAEEGCRLESYRDTEDNWSIGWGTCLEGLTHITDGLDDGFPLRITQDLADQWLTISIHSFCKQIERKWSWTKDLDNVRYAALVSMAYCMGTGDKGVGGFEKMLAHLECGDYDSAANEVIDSKWGRGKAALRAQRTSFIFRTGSLPPVFLK